MRSDRDYVICSVVIVGGNAWNGASDGALYWNSNNPLSLVNVNIGGRGLQSILNLCLYKMISHDSLAELKIECRGTASRKSNGVS